MKLSESDTRAKLIDPKLREAGWEEQYIIRDRTITDGRIITTGGKISRGKKKKPDYILYYGSLPIAVVEAKDTTHSPLDGLQQAKEYAEMLRVKFAYSTNGYGIEEFDFTTNKQQSLEKFPSPESLWSRYALWESRYRGFVAAEKFDVYENPLLVPYYHEAGGKVPRYYQEAAITEVIKAFLNDKKRILLTMATGTGKTFTAFQVVWKLIKANKVRRVLYIADRNFLRNQAYIEFAPFADARALILNFAT